MTPVAWRFVFDQSRHRSLGASKACPLECVSSTPSVTVIATASDLHLVSETQRLEAASPMQSPVYPRIYHLEMTASELGTAPHHP